MHRRWLSLWLAPALLVTSACASKLPRELTGNAPVGVALEQDLDMRLVTFRDLASGAEVNVHDYMREAGRDWLLLTFGSRSCSACNHKADELTERVIDKHPLYLTDAGRRFEIVGVNTDRDSFARLKPFLARYPFIRWSDPSGTQMLSHFMPSGRFRVPLTVMVSASGIAWRVLPDETTTVDELIAKVERTLAGIGGGADAGQGEDGGGVGDNAGDGGGGSGRDDGDGDSDGGGSGGDTDDDGIRTAPLMAELPGRLKRVAVSACDGQPTTLDAALGGAQDLRFVTVTRGACGADCRANQREIERFAAACAAGQIAGRTCAAVALTSEAPDRGQCVKGLAYRGGGEFFDVFQSYFNAHYPVAENPDDYTVSLPPVVGPLTFGFAADGRLVYSHEGRLADGALRAAISAPRFGDRLPGPDFRLYTKDARLGAVTSGQEIRFAALRQRARFTVVAGLALYPFACGPCLDELTHWSRPGELVDFCAARPADCQVVYVEANAPDDGVGVSDFYEAIVNGDAVGHPGLPAMSIRVPLALDPETKYMPDGNLNTRRYYDGYMLAAKPEWGSDPRSFIYDREGKIVAMFVSESIHGVDPVLAKVKELLRVTSP